MDGHRIRCFILQADAVVPTPRWCCLCLSLRAERQERLGRDELQLFVNPKLNHGVGDTAISTGLMRQGHEFRNLGLEKDVLPLLVGEIELLQPHECPDHAMKDITDTFLVAGDAHGLIRLQDPGGAASFV
ncbi:unnamed protein product [Miscanthus lutarioriparius]|uniref:Uncharacterized protein n=1 Tax=Miscanthus lutarioriparius TaxID=422564 RepID=A0A811QCR1_9POAL|nr:unnamed protein product [Miscanthus lutarioriparius]